MNKDECETFFGDGILPRFSAKFENGIKEHFALNVIMGQSGAGKTAVQESILHGSDQIISIDTDEIRALHPDFVKHVLCDSEKGSFALHEEAKAWSRMLLAEAMATKTSVIFPYLGNKPENMVGGRFNNAVESGATVNVFYIATHPEDSWLGCELRYETALKNLQRTGAPSADLRRVSYEQHKAGFNTALTALRYIEEKTSGNPSVILRAHTRTGEELYSSENGGTIGGCRTAFSAASEYIKKQHSSTEAILDRVCGWKEVLKCRESRQDIEGSKIARDKIEFLQLEL